MKVPSHRARAIKAATDTRNGIAESLRLAVRGQTEGRASEVVSPDSLVQHLIAAEQAIADAEALPDTFTCPQCGKDFKGAHVELNAVSLLEFGPDGVATHRFDFGLGRARRFKFCAGCIKKWKHKPIEYINL